MRVLLLTQIVPNPPNAGPKIKTHYVLRTLAEEHDVELVTFTRSDEEVEHARQLGAWCSAVTTIPLARSRVREPWYAASGWARRTPFLVARDYRAEFANHVERRLASGDIDVVHADQLTMAQYLAPGRYPGVRRVFDAHNAVWELVRDIATRQPTPVHRAAAEVEWRLLRSFEGCAARTSTLTLCVSERDRAALEQAAGQPIASAVVPIGVEVREQPITPLDPAARRLLSVATMHYPPNAEAIRWFARDVWPLVTATAPDVNLDVVGPRPPGDIEALGSSDSRITVHGFVEDVDELYRQAAAFIVPLRSGSGVRVKILEAMARGLPVVSTTIGADGLDVEHGRHLLIADTPADFARCVAALLDDPGLRMALARAARERALERYDWRACCRPVLDAYRRMGAPDRALPEPLLAR